MDNRKALLSYINDAHKDAYGFRSGNWEYYNSLTLEQLQAEADELSAAVCDTIDRETAEKEAAAVKFEVRVNEVIASGAKDRETALRWIFEAEDITADVEVYRGSYAAYHFGLPYGYFEKEYPEYQSA